MNSISRIEEEKNTVGVMIRLYCRNNHGQSVHLCEECSALLQYAHKRLDFCPHKEMKPPCSKCAIHCYKTDMRELMRKVMRYSGPRMIYCHPVMAIRHLLREMRAKR